MWQLISLLVLQALRQLHRSWRPLVPNSCLSPAAEAISPRVGTCATECAMSVCWPTFDLHVCMKESVCASHALTVLAGAYLWWCLSDVFGQLMKVVSGKTLTLPQKSGCKICSKKTAPITRSSRSSRRALAWWRLHACYPKPHASQTKYQRVPQVTPSVGSCISPSCHGRTKLCATIWGLNMSQSILRERRSEIPNLNIHALEQIWSKDDLPNLKTMKKRRTTLTKHHLESKSFEFEVISVESNWGSRF